MSKVSLGSVVRETVGGGTPERGNAEFWNGEIPWATVKDFKDSSYEISATKESISEKGLKFSASNLIPSGTPIVCTRMAVGRIARPSVPVAINQDLRALFIRDDFDTSYIVWAIDSIRNRIENLSIGSTVKGISIDQLLSFEIHNPSKPEQSKIAEVLSTVDRAIEQTEALIAKQQRIKTGLMQDLLTCGIDEHGNLRYEETHEFKDSPLGRIPVEWKPTTLGDLGTWSSGGTPSKSNPRFWDGEIPWVTPKDMKSFDLKSTTDNITDAGVRFGSKLMPEGTVFIVVRGMILAHTFPVVYATRPMSFNQDVKAIVSKPGVDAKYLAYWLIAHKHAMLKITTTATHGTKRFDMNEVYAVNVQLPREDEQHRIVEFLDHCQEQILLTKFQGMKLRSIKTGLMQDLLTGKKRVTPLLAAERDG